MPRFESFKNISQGIFYWIVIAVIALIAIWLVISTVGNVVLNRQAEVPTVPDADKCRYAFFIEATNQTVFTDKYDIAYHKDAAGNIDRSKKVFTLHGYYELNKKKYLWNKGDITLDEFYFGKILLIDRGIPLTAHPSLALQRL